MTSRGPSLRTISEIVGFVLGFTLVLTLLHTNDLLKQQLHQQGHTNELAEDANGDRLRSEYQRILLGCNTAGAVESRDQNLRELCDVYLPALKLQLKEHR